MAWMDSRALEYRRKLFTRPDAYRFAAPGTPEAKMPGWLDPSATRVRLKEAQEEEAAAAFAIELAELRASHERAREMLAEVKYELAWRRLCRKYGYNPNQPRVPGGNPDGGQWTNDEQWVGQRNGPAALSGAAPNNDSTARVRYAALATGGSSSVRDDSSGNVRLAAMSWDEQVKKTFGQKDLFTEVGAGRGGGGGIPELPFFRGNGPTAGVLRTQKGDTQIVSGSGGPASKMPQGSPGYDRYTRTHAEGHATAIMEKQGVMEGTLFLNNSPCPKCKRNLRYMLRPGARLDVHVVPTGARFRFYGVER